jgi:hypothetical protein
MEDYMSIHRGAKKKKTHANGRLCQKSPDEKDSNTVMQTWAGSSMRIDCKSYQVY